MKTLKSNGMLDDSFPGLRRDPSLLLESLRESILKGIEENGHAADDEIKKMNDALQVEIDQFRTAEQRKYEERIAAEESKMRNLLSSEMKKRKLEVVESFIGDSIREASLLLRADPRYGDFLKFCVRSAIDEVKGKSVTVIISVDDINFSDEIMKELEKSGYNTAAGIITDDSAAAGGVMVVDNETGIVYNNTVERIIYRNNYEIRREIIKILKISGIYEGD